MFQNRLKYCIRHLAERKRMENQLRQRTSELIKMNKELKRQIEEKEKMANAKNEAEAVCKAKSEFLAVMSHEISKFLSFMPI